MIIRINGEDVDFKEGISVEDLLFQRNINLKGVVVECNHVILKQQEWRKTILKQNDDLEVISFVGGG